MAEFDWQSRMKITEQRAKELKNRIQGLSGMEGQLALDLKDNRIAGRCGTNIMRQRSWGCR